MKSNSPSKTKKLGFNFAKKILKEKFSQPIIVGLRGNLGSGKTTFIQGFARGLGIKNRIMSPTFVIFRHYPLRKKSRAHFFHMDAYRIKKLSELKHLDFEEITSLPKSVVLVEWPEKIKKALPKKTKWLEFRHGEKENERNIEFGK
ncbi:MAG: tRNA (adenosine(37)-N6)-threonylcarbamoyltransferase complex ATPase subunit type 1 TsaE [Patescibacteria group bacterium]